MPIGKVIWVSDQYHAHHAEEYVTVFVIHSDGTIEQESFTRRGQQCGDEWYPSHLRAVPTVCHGYRSLGGHTDGCDLDGFRRGRTNNFVLDDPVLRRAARQCWKALEVAAVA